MRFRRRASGAIRSELAVPAGTLFNRYFSRSPAMKGTEQRGLTGRKGEREREGSGTCARYLCAVVRVCLSKQVKGGGALIVLLLFPPVLACIMVI